MPPRLTKGAWTDLNQSGSDSRWLAATSLRRPGRGAPDTSNYLSNHCHLLPRPTSATELAAFITYFNSSIAREAGYRAYRGAYRDAKRALREHQVPVRFPRHGIPPPLNLVVDRA